MPLSAAYAWYLTRLMQRYRIPEAKPVPVSVQVSTSTSSSLGTSAQSTTASEPRGTKLG
jgi:hypothetical protein